MPTRKAKGYTDSSPPKSSFRPPGRSYRDVLKIILAEVDKLWRMSPQELRLYIDTAIQRRKGKSNEYRRSE